MENAKEEIKFSMNGHRWRCNDCTSLRVIVVSAKAHVLLHCDRCMNNAVFSKEDYMKFVKERESKAKSNKK